MSRMTMRVAAMRAALAAACLLAGAVAAAPDAAAESTLPGVARTAPTEDYRRAADAFDRGDREEGAFWFYRAQLRARIHLAARPDVKAQGDLALLNAFNDRVGKLVDRFAAEEAGAHAAAVERALAWHATREDAFTPKAQFGEAHAKGRFWLAGALLQAQARRDRGTALPGEPSAEARHAVVAAMIGQGAASAR